jgi:hypothetical protein
MNIAEYLNTYFANGSTCTLEKPLTESGESLETHFAGKFGVDIKNEGDLFLFKYNMISAKWSFPITHECRGVILRYDGQWEYVCKPWNKFWNLGEINSPLSHEPFFEKFVNEFQILSKEDGTACSCWFDDVKNKWRISTLGTITPQVLDRYDNITFEDLFWKVFGEDAKQKLYKYGNKDYTYLFELCCVENRIVTSYPDNRIYLIGIRHKISGVYLPYS